MIVSYGFVSDETPVREGLCVYCATPRPISKPICPHCGRTWIDTRIGEEMPPLTPEIVAASAEEREALAATGAGTATGSPESRRPWGLLVGLILGGAAVAAIYFGVINNDGDATAATTATVAAVDTTAGPTTTPATTIPATTTAPTTTGPSTTTSSTTTSTTTPTTTTTLAPIEAVGNPVPIADLDLGAFTLGPFGLDAGTSYLGRLVASLGQPDARTSAGTELGLCPDDEGVAYVWGGLTGIFRVDGETEVLVGYRLDAIDGEHPTTAITTRSGLQLGHTLEKLGGIYTQSGLTTEDIGGTPHFLLLRSSDTLTLLWGPLTDAEQTGTVQGIYSPQACDGGPRPTS